MDYVSVMTYDYHGKPIQIRYSSMQILFFSFDLGKWDQVTGINSPLYRSHSEIEENEDWKNTVRSRGFSLKKRIRLIN